jgi:hypothetical protein
MKLVKKNITKRRRYKNRRRIIRGGTIDDDVKQLLKSLENYDHNSIADFLESYKGHPNFQAACKKIGDRFDNIDNMVKNKSECNYTKSFENFVKEMLTTTIKTLRDSADKQQKPKLTPDAIDGLYQGMDDANIEMLIDSLMQQYIKAKGGPCLSVVGQATTTHVITSKPSLLKIPLRKVGGSIRKKSRRLRRKQRGGDVISMIIGAAFVLTMMYVIVRMIAANWNHTRGKTFYLGE